MATKVIKNRKNKLSSDAIELRTLIEVEKYDLTNKFQLKKRNFAA
jgi:hypothetical protein